MDTAKLILPETVQLPISLEHLSKTSDLNEEKKKQFAKDFESVLLHKLLEEMKNTIGDWGFEEDETSEQIQGIFWLCLARDIADNGGLGLWKDIYQSLASPEQKNTAPESLDENV